MLPPYSVQQEREMLSFHFIYFLFLFWSVFPDFLLTDIYIPDISPYISHFNNICILNNYIQTSNFRRPVTFILSVLASSS